MQIKLPDKKRIMKHLRNLVPFTENPYDDSEKAEADLLDEQKRKICGNLNFAAAEAYKLLRANLLFTLPENDCKIVGITSASRGEGKSTTAINISYTIAQAKKKVLLIDADMRIPTVAKRLDKQKTPGLSNVLVGQAKAISSIQPSGVLKEFDVLTAGDIPPNPSELLGSQKMDTILDELSEKYDFIIIDLPPVNLVSDAIVLSSRINGLIVVVRDNFTLQSDLREAIGKLEFLESKILGFCLTDVDDGSAHYSRYRSGGKYRRYYKGGSYKGYRKYGYRRYGYDKYGYGKNSYEEGANKEISHEEESSVETDN